eukprot:s3830_g9.t1
MPDEEGDLDLPVPAMDGDDAEAWDKVGLESPPQDSPPEGPAEIEERRARLRRLDKEIQDAVPKVTAEEEAALDIAKLQKAAKAAQQQTELCEGEMPTRRWLEEKSGAVALPRRRRRATDPGLDEETVEVIKMREEQKWATEAQIVVDLLNQNPDLPIVKGAAEPMRPDEYMMSAVGAFRASTVRKRLREWRKFVQWLEIVHQVRWPSKRVHVVDYLTELRLTEAPVTVPQSFATTLGFFERTAGIAKDEMLSSDAVFKKALDHTNKEMDIRRPEKKRAPLLPVSVIAAMEMLVVSEGAPTFLRFSAWIKLIKVWSASRTDDLQGVALRSLKFNKVGMYGIFWRTKVSGPGKKNKVLPFMVSCKVSITGLPWLRVGMTIMEEHYWYPRDYLVPSYPDGLEALDAKRPASYEDFVVMSRLVYSNLKEIHYEHGRWISGKEPLLLPELVRHWTEHSERNWLVSMAAATGIGREERQMLGRWAVRESSDEYVRSAQRIVAMIQCTLLEKLRMDREWDLRNSGLDAVREFLCGINYEAGSIDKQMARLEIPEVWVPAELDASFLGLVSRPAGMEAGMVGSEAIWNAAEVPEAEKLPGISEIMSPEGPEEQEDEEEDDIDVAGRFFISINLRQTTFEVGVTGRESAMPLIALTAAEEEAAAESADSDLKYLLTDVGVPDQIQLALFHRGYTSLRLFAGIDESRTEVRTAVTAEIGLDHAVGNAERRHMALLLSAWETSRTQQKANDEARAEARSTMVPRPVAINEHAMLREALELQTGRLKDYEVPAKSLVAAKMDDVELNLPRVEDLRDVASLEDGEADVLQGTLDASTGTFRMKPARTAILMPRNAEELRLRHRRLAIAWEMVRTRTATVSGYRVGSWIFTGSSVITFSAVT